jgi:light-regulated signal transduction histidine kinase (bacteriophytochrome)
VIFQRLHGRELYSGTGIGLALVKKIVEFHGGRVWLDVAPRDEPGAIIRFTLPVEQAEQPQQEQQ